MLTLSHVSDVAFFLLFHGDCVRGDFFQFQWERIVVIVEVEVQHIGVKMLRSVLLFLCGKAEKCFRSIVSSGFTLELSQSRGAFLQAVQACGASMSVGGVQPIQTKSLTSDCSVFHTATQKFCLLNQHQVNNYYVPPQSFIHCWFIKHIIVIPRGDKGYPIIRGFQLSDRGLAQPLNLSFIMMAQLISL